MMGGWALWGLLAFVFLLAIAAAVIFLAVWMVRRSATAAAEAPRQGPLAGDILRRRFASGEIDDEEFTRRLALLERE